MPLDPIWRDGLPPDHPSKRNEAAETYLTLLAHQKGITDKDGNIIDKADETVTTETGLVADDRAPRRKRKRGKRKPINVDALIESESAGALDWAKKASEGE